jgi:hypothetical protein
MVKDSPGEDNNNNSAEAQAHVYDCKNYRMDQIEEEWDNILMSSPSTSRSQTPCCPTMYVSFY